MDPNLVATLPFLINLDLRLNQITSMNSLNRKPPEGEDTVYWPRLQNVYLSSNLIEKVTQIGCPNLIMLDISNNKIIQIAEGTPDAFTGHDNIQILDLSGNQLRSLTTLTNMKKLRKVYLTGNKILKFHGFNDCEELEEINMRDNQVFF